jgi:hypothetical protein
VFLAQDAEARTFRYSNADPRNGEEAGECYTTNVVTYVTLALMPLAVADT